VINVILYSRQDCHLCEQAQADLAALQSVVPHNLTVIDVDSTEELRQRFGFEVPVVEVGPYRLKAPFGPQELRMTLGAAQDRQQHIEDIENSSASGLSTQWTPADRFTNWFSNHYVAVLNILVLVYLLLPVLAPVLMKAGFERPASLIYRGYSLVCHQLAFRSFFIFGEQAVYPRQAAEVPGLLSYSQATGLGEDSSVADLYGARTFVGNPVIGYKIALCERDIFIYGGILLFGLIFGLVGRRIPSLPWYMWVLLGIVPIALDGFSQLFSQPPMNFLPYRESSPFLRSLTGFLFGFSTAWFGYPMVEASMAESRKIMQRKLERIRRNKASPDQATSTAD
jgi:uncharacterized membrane protein